MILLDTHVVAWLALDSSRISHKARNAISGQRESGNGLAICDMSLLELGVLARKGRIQLDISIESFLREVESRFVVLPLSGRACARALDLPSSYPRDPADRVIGATAMVEGLTLVTADRAIQKSGLVRTIW